MPVTIYRVKQVGQDNERVTWLCDDEWPLTPQVEALCAWLKVVESTLPPADYIADVGFCWRRNAMSGGPVLEPGDMTRMAAFGMTLFLSEYGGFADE